jgi:hypothetical protein
MVLFENQENGFWVGHTGNYMKVQVTSGTALHNQILPVLLAETRGDVLFGTIV